MLCINVNFVEERLKSNKAGHVPCKTFQEAWDLAQEKLAKQGKKDYTITIMGHASATLPILDK